MHFTNRRPSPPLPVSEQAQYFCYQNPPLESYRHGYPRISAFMQSDREFVLFRRFGQLHARILLHKQDTIVYLEQELNELDNNDTNSFSLNSRRADQNVARHNLLAKLEPKLIEYDALLEAYFRQLERHRPQERNIRSVSNWFMGTKPLVANESTFLNNWDDLVSPMRGVTCTGIETFVGNCAALIRRHWCSSVFTSKVACSLSDDASSGKSLIEAQEDAEKSIDQHLIYITSARVVVVTRLLTSFSAVLLLTLPIVILYNVSSVAIRLAVIALCATKFALFISLLSQTRLIEVFSATAAFYAVLVVFVGNFS